MERRESDEPNSCARRQYDQQDRSGRGRGAPCLRRQRTCRKFDRCGSDEDRSGNHGGRHEPHARDGQRLRHEPGGCKTCHRASCDEQDSGSRRSLFLEDARLSRRGLADDSRRLPLPYAHAKRGRRTRYPSEHYRRRHARHRRDGLQSGHDDPGRRSILQYARAQEVPQDDAYGRQAHQRLYDEARAFSPRYSISSHQQQ